MNDQILKAREERFEHIKSISKNYQTIILLKANTPGKNKERYSSFFLVNLFNHVIEDQFNVIYKTFKKGYDGPYYIYAIQSNEFQEIKHALIDIETTHPLRSCCTGPRRCVQESAAAPGTRPRRTG